MGAHSPAIDVDESNVNAILDLIGEEQATAFQNWQMMRIFVPEKSSAV